jgi:hypothetical protein
MSDELNQQTQATEAPVATGESTEANPLKKALDAERLEKVALRKQLAELSKKVEQFNGIDLAEVQSLKEKQEAVERQKQEEAQRWGDLRLSYEEKLKATGSELNQTKAALEAERLENALNKAYFGSDGLSDDDFDLLKPKAMKHVKLIDGKPTVVDPDGTQRYNEKGEPMTLKEVMAEFASKGSTSKLFRAQNTNAGSGMTASSQAKGAKGNTLVNPSPKDIGKNLEAIAAGKLKVVR